MSLRTSSTLLVISTLLLAANPAMAETGFDVEAGEWRAEPGASRSFRDFVSLLKESPEEFELKRAHAQSWSALWGADTLRVNAGSVERDRSAHPSVRAALADIFGEPRDLPGGDLKMPLGIDVRARPPVVAFVNFWTGRARATMSYYLARMGRYEPMIRKIFKEEGVPEDMIFLCLIESGFSPRAHSIANAGGMWQFIPATAVNYGLRIDGEVDERRDPVKATRAAARLLRNLYEKLGSWPLAMAGYNAGSGHVIKAMRKANSDSYWVLARRDALYDNTRDYVAKILAAGLIANNREAFGFEAVVPHPPLQHDTVQIPGGTALAAVAESLGVGVDLIRRLNPELLAARAPGRVKSYPLNIPAGQTSRFVREFNQVSTQPQQHEGYLYTLRVGETVSMAAAQLGVPAHLLRSVSGFDTKARVPYGSKLVVPRALLAQHAPHLIPRAGVEITAPAPLQASSVRKPTALLPAVRYRYSDQKRVFYRTQAGDTLAELSHHFKVHASLISMWNELETNDALKAGLMLQLFVPASFDLGHAIVLEEHQVSCVYDGTDAFVRESARQRNRPAGSGGGGGRSYNVKRGDSLDSIAARFGTTRAELERWNNLRGRAIKPGYRLVIYPSRVASPDASASRAAADRPSRNSNSGAVAASQEEASGSARKSVKKRRRAATRRPVKRSGLIRHRLH